MWALSLPHSPVLKCLGGAEGWQVARDCDISWLRLNLMFSPWAGSKFHAKPLCQHCWASQVWGEQYNTGIKASTACLWYWYKQILALYILELQRQNQIVRNDGRLPLQHKIPFCILWQTGGLLKLGKQGWLFLHFQEEVVLSTFCQSLEVWNWLFMCSLHKYCSFKVKAINFSCWLKLLLKGASFPNSSSYK